MAVLYFYRMNLDKEKLSDPDRDRLVLSKGHAVLAQYAALCEKGFFPREELKKLKMLGGLLQGHPDLTIPGIEAVTGSLGQGLSVGLGMALALRLNRSPARVYVVMGDGEQAEGQIWEAAMAAANFKAGNLTAFLDWNKVQATGPTGEVLDNPHLDRKWEAFGWKVIPCAGHDPAKIIAALETADKTRDKPSLIMLDTVKGKGFSFAEGNAAFHNGILSEELYARALAELGQARAALGGPDAAKEAE
ncbi:MAG: transketolase, partial [Treponema sp.]|jgi:transketolase|nr:transketolase [Treponema sp.]